MNTKNNNTSNYLDGFVFPINKNHLETYKTIAEKIADIWKANGAVEYKEFVIDDIELHNESTKSFIESVNAKEDEVIIFGWVMFPSKYIRNEAHHYVSKDKEMMDLITPLINPKQLIFDSKRMAFGGFNSLV